MKEHISIKLKAIFLLIVFALNTVIWFACSVGLDMGFNSKHHYDETIEAAHIHKDGKRHVHHEKKEGHSHGKSHHHDQANNYHKSENDKDNCCNDKVISFEQLDKSVPNSLSIDHPVFFTVLIATFYNIVTLFYRDAIRDIKPFVRSYHPPISDIRIAIQSFQI